MTVRAPALGNGHSVLLADLVLSPAGRTSP
jgi:hypothetical protein